MALSHSKLDLEKSKAGARRIALNTFFLTLSSLANLAIAVATTSIIARSIGPELYGRYTFGLTYVLIFSSLANLGLESLYIREAARDRSQLVLIGDIFHLKIVLAVVTIGAILASAYVFGYPSTTLEVLQILCVGLFFQILSEALLSVYRSVERMHVTAMFSTIFRLISAAVVGLSIYFELGFYGIVAAFSIGNSVVFFGVLAVFWREFKLLRLRIRPEYWIELIRKGMPFYLSALLTMFYAKTNILILSKLVSDQDMGFYMAALNLVENLYFIPTAFATAAFPAFSRLHGTSIDALKRTYSKMIRFLIILTTAVALGTILVSESIVGLIYGARFAPSAAALNILIFLWALAFFSNVQSILLFSIQKEKIQVRVMLVAVLANGFLNFALIHGHGYRGAAVASVVTEALVVWLISFFLWRLGFRYKPDWRLVRLVPVGVGMALVVNTVLQYSLVAAVLAGAMSYGALLLLLRVFDDEDLSYMAALIKRKVASS